MIRTTNEYSPDSEKNSQQKFAQQIFTKFVQVMEPLRVQFARVCFKESA